MSSPPSLSTWLPSSTAAAPPPPAAAAAKTKKKRGGGGAANPTRSAATHPKPGKAKFPLSRIKRIMQKDDHVGKVAMASPVLVSKSLEMFLSSLLAASCEETRLRGAQRVTPAHLKRSVVKYEQFDFLQDIVEAIPDVDVKAEKVGRRGRPRTGEVRPSKRTKIAAATTSPTATPASTTPSVPSATEIYASYIPPQQQQQSGYSNMAAATMMTNPLAVGYPTATIMQPFSVMPYRYHEEEEEDVNYDEPDEEDGDDDNDEEEQ